MARHGHQRKSLIRIARPDWMADKEKDQSIQMEGH